MPSRSSSASRKTWLSSTRRIRIGRPMPERTLLARRQKQVVMRLAALLDVDLDAPDAPSAIAAEQAVERRLVLARRAASAARAAR